MVENFPDLAVMVEPLLIVRRVLREQIGILHRRLLAVVRDDEVCRRLMTVPGVRPVVALTYRATVDVPARFRKSKSVVRCLADVRQISVGEIDRSGAISRCRRDDPDILVSYCSGQAEVKRDIADLVSIRLPPAIDVVATYGLAVLTDNPAAERLALYLLSEKGQTIIAENGLVPVFSEQK